MNPYKAMVLGGVLLALVAVLGLVFALSADALIDSEGPFTSWGRGGCHGRYSDDDDRYGACHDRDDRSYCPYDGRYYGPEDWEEHREDCPYYDSNN